MSVNRLIKFNKTRGKQQKNKTKKVNQDSVNNEKLEMFKGLLIDIQVTQHSTKISLTSDAVIVTRLFFDQGYEDVLHLKKSVFRTTGSCHEVGGSGRR